MKEPLTQPQTLPQQATKTNQIKSQMATKIAYLNQLTQQRRINQQKLFDFTTQVKQLRTKQYQLHRKGVAFECQRTELLKREAEMVEDIRLCSAVGRRIQDEIKGNDEKRKAGVENNINLSKRNAQIQSKITTKNTQISTLQTSLHQILQNHKKSISLQSSRSQILTLLHSSHNYYTNKLAQLNSKITQKSINVKNQQKLTIELKQQIQSKQTKLLQLSSNIKITQSDAIQLNERISSERLRGRVMEQKHRILNKKLDELMETEKYSRKLIEIKQQKQREQYQRQRCRGQKWREVRYRIGVELEYARYCCGKFDVLI